MRTKLTPEQVTERLAATPSWGEANNEIHRSLSFPTYMAGVRFLDAVAELAETLDHHPRMVLEWCKLTLSLNTHDAGGITDTDFDFAQKVDALFAAEA